VLKLQVDQTVIQRVKYLSRLKIFLLKQLRRRSNVKGDVLQKLRRIKKWPNHGWEFYFAFRTEGWKGSCKLMCVKFVCFSRHIKNIDFPKEIFPSQEAVTNEDVPAVKNQVMYVAIIPKKQCWILLFTGWDQRGWKYSYDFTKYKWRRSTIYKESKIGSSIKKTLSVF